MAGLPSKSGKEWTIIIGASGGVEGFATGLTASGRKNKQGTTVGRVSMVHSSRNISGSDLSGWDNYSEGDLRDFSALGITQPNNILTEGDFSGYERIFVATSITGARRDIDISSDIPVNKVSVERGRIKLNSFIIDGRGRGFIVESEYDMPDHVHTEIMLRADNDYGLIDDDNSIRDYAIRRLIKSDVDAETFMWEEKLGVIGLSEETLDWLEALLVAKERGSATVPLSDSMLLLRKKNIPVDTAIDMALKGDCELKISNDFLLIVDKRNLEADSVENIKNAGARQDI